MEREHLPAVPTYTVLVGTNDLLREGLARILSTTEFRVVASQSYLDDRLLNSLPHDRNVLLVIDVSDDFDRALRQIESFKQACPAACVAVLGPSHQLPEMMSAFRAGANAYLPNVTTYQTFIKCLELVALNMTLLPPEILVLISDRYDRPRAGEIVNSEEPVGEGPTKDDDTEGNLIPGHGHSQQASQAASTSTQRLSPRQEAILRCLILGDSNRTIARKMEMAEATVKAHVKAVLRRIRAHNRTQAAVWAMSHCPSVAVERNGASMADCSPDRAANDEPSR